MFKTLYECHDFWVGDGQTDFLYRSKNIQVFEEDGNRVRLEMVERGADIFYA